MEVETTMTLGEYRSQAQLEELFWASIGTPCGVTMLQDTESYGEDYCDLDEFLSELDWDDLIGEVRGGTWNWTGGGGRPVDCLNNTLTLLRVSGKKGVFRVKFSE